MNKIRKHIDCALGESSFAQRIAIIAMCLVFVVGAKAQDQTVEGSLDVLAGPITLGTAQVWDGIGTWDPNNSTLISAAGLTLSFQDTGAWTGGSPEINIMAHFHDPDSSPNSGDEFWSWTDQDGYQTQSGTSMSDYYSNTIDGYSQSTLTVYHVDAVAASYQPGLVDINFTSAKPETTFRWQVMLPNGNGSFTPQALMELSSGALMVSAPIHAGDISASTIYASGELVSYGSQNVMDNQTLNAGTGSIMTLGLSDARYLRKDSTVSVSGSYAGGIGQNLISGGTQFVSGKNNVSDSTALFIVGGGDSTSSRKNALTISSAGNTIVDGSLTVTGATELSGGLTVTGGTTSLQALSATSGSFSGNTSVSGTFAVAGASALSGGLTVIGGATSVQALSATSGSFSGNATVSGDLSVAGKATVGGGNTASGAGSVAFGHTTVASGAVSFAQGYETSATGDRAVALGTSTVASGYHSIAGGGWSYASGSAAVALGHWNSANADFAAAIGGECVGVYARNSFGAGSWANIFGERSMGIGRGVFVVQNDQTVMGRWNDYTRTDLPTDLLFVLGNGLEDPANMYWGQTNPYRSNAIEVQLSGRTTIRHKEHLTDVTAEALNIQGTAAISNNLSVGGTLKVGGQTALTQGSGNSAYLTAGQIASTYLTSTAAAGQFVPSGSTGLVVGEYFTYPGSGASGSTAVSLGQSALAASGAISIGVEAGAPTYQVFNSSWGPVYFSQGADAVSIGRQAKGRGTNSVAIGRLSDVTGWGVAVGGDAKAEMGVSLGSAARSDESGVSLGFFAGNASLYGETEYVTAGPDAVSIGLNTAGAGAGSVAIGSSSSANSSTRASAARSIAVGTGIRAFKPGQIVLGSYSVLGTVTTESADTDDILIIGSGTDNDNRANAFVVKRNGDAQVKQDAKVARNLEVSGDASFGGTASINNSLSVTGTATVGGDAPGQGTLTAKRIRVLPGGDLPMDADFQNGGTEGAPFAP